jgi:hypothetical protein
VYLANNVDSGPSGTTITVANSDNTGGNPFDVVDSSGANAVLQYQASPARSTAEFVMKATNGNSATSPLVAWTTSAGTQSQVYVRMYAYIQTMTASNAPLFLSSLSGSICGMLEVAGTATPHLWLEGLSSFLAGTVTVPIGAWFRVEARMAFGTAGVPGSAEARFYVDADSDVISETLTLPSYDSRNATANEFKFGCTQALANYSTTFYSGLAISTDGWIGPAPRRLGTGAPTGNLTSPIAVHTAVA